MDIYDVIIIGGGPAGMNAAVVLGRCHRNVLLFDSGSYRNRMSHGMHNYLTRDDILPPDFIKISRSEIKKYGVKLKEKTVSHIQKLRNGQFKITDESASVYHSKMVLIATGLTDKVPDIPGMKELYGKSVFHCPYCDGWEITDRSTGIYAKNKNGSELAASLFTWTNKLVYFTDGRRTLKPAEKALLDLYKIPVVTKKIDKLEGKNGKLKNIILRNAEPIACEALFFVNGYSQQCNLGEKLGCEINSKKVIVTNKLQQTNIPGVYVAGDSARDMHFVVVAAAEGAKAGVTINKQLQKEERELMKVRRKK